VVIDGLSGNHSMRKKPGSKLLLFDIDGVVIDSFQPIYADCMSFIERHGGAGVTQDQFRDMFNGNALAAVLEAAGVKDGEAIEEEMLRELFRSYHQAKIFEGMPEVLQKLAEKHVIVAVTSSMKDPVLDKLEEAGVSELFAAFLGPQTAVHKDQKIQMALEEFGAQTSGAYFVSDTLGDLLEANKTGVKTIGVTWGYHDSARLSLAVPNLVVTSPAQLLQTLQ